MKLNNKIEIDFLEFFKTGKFDYLKLGQTKEWVRNNFPDPDHKEFEHNIWQYGNIELHFYEDELFLIFSDYLQVLSGGKSLELKKWILDTPDLLTLEYVISKLNEEKIDFTKVHHKICKNVIEITITDSNVQLTFIDYDEADINPNQYMLSSFGLMNKPWIKEQK